MIATENITEYDPTIACASRVFYGMGMSLAYRFGAQEWELSTRTTRTGLARFRPSTTDLPMPDAKPSTFTEAAQVAERWLAENCTRIWADDRERMTETAADYLA